MLKRQPMSVAFFYDIKELIGYRRELHHIMTTATSSIGKTMLKLSSDLINEHRPQTPGGEDSLIVITGILG